MKTILCTLIIIGSLVGSVAYGQTAPPVTPARPAPPASPSPPSPPVPPAPPSAADDATSSPILFNIRVDVAVTEEGAGEPVSRKEVSVTVGDNRFGLVRSGAMAAGEKFQDSRLRVDVRPRVESNGKIRTLVTLLYLSSPHFSREGEQKFEVLLDDGKPLIVSRASSAISERRLRVDVTATILK